MLEEHLRRAMLVSRGDVTSFVTSPISAVLLLVAALLIASVLAPAIRAKREEAFQDED